MTRNQMEETHKKLHRGPSERQWKGVCLLDWEFVIVSPDYIDQWAERNSWEKMWVSWWSHLVKQEKGFWAAWEELALVFEVTRWGFKFPVMTLRVLTISPQGSTHSTSSSAPWQGVCVIVTATSENEPVLRFKKTCAIWTMPSCLLLSCHSLSCLLSSSYSSVPSKLELIHPTCVFYHVILTGESCLHFCSFRYHIIREVHSTYPFPFTVTSHF